MARCAIDYFSTSTTKHPAKGLAWVLSARVGLFGARGIITLLDFDDEAGRGLLRLVALSIEGLPGGRLEERYSIVDAVPFDDADIGRRRCALDGDDTAAQRENPLPPSLSEETQ